MTMCRDDGYVNGRMYYRSGLPSEGEQPETLVYSQAEHMRPPKFTPEHAAVITDLHKRFSYEQAD